MTKLTRRQAAAALSIPVMALAQAPQSLTPSLPANSEEELNAARAVLRDNSDQLARVALPMSTEPAVHFKA